MSKIAPTVVKFVFNILIVLLVLCSCPVLHAQIGINVPANDSPQAQLDIRQGQENLPGMLIPRVSSLPVATGDDEIEEGLMVFLQGENPNFYVYVDDEWQTIAESAGLDITPPAAPGSFSASNPTSSTIDLTWTASTDNVGVEGYKIYDASDDSLVATVTGSTSTTISGLSSNTSYTFYATAYDAAGNESDPSNTASSTTLQPCYVVGDYDMVHQGIVFWVNPIDCSNYKIISMSNMTYGNDDQFRYSKDTDEQGQESNSDGYGNNLNWIQDYDTARLYRSDVTGSDDIKNTALFLAFNFYGGATNGWYLGAPEEWDEVYSHRNIINDALDNHSGSSLNSGGDRYWTSKQHDNNEAYTFKMNGGSSSKKSKSSLYYVRSFFEVNGVRTVKIGDLINDGIVTYINSNTDYKVFALEELPSKRWGWSGHNCGHGQEWTDGLVNTTRWVNNSNHQGRPDYENTALFTSYMYRPDGGDGHDGWYLPAPNELRRIKASHQLLNEILSDYGNTIINMGYHWTSRYFNNSKAYQMHLAWKNPYETNKNNTSMRVRPMKRVN